MMKTTLIGSRSMLWAACVIAVLPAAARAGEPTLAQAIPIEQSDSTAIATSIERTTPASTSPLIVTVQLLGSNAPLRGELISTPQLSVTTSFGDVSVPLSEVAGIKVASANNPTTTIVLHNGDSITGACEVGRIDLKTEWGRAEVQGTSINTILFVEGVSWIADEALGGKRWQLIEKRSETAGKSLNEGDSVVATANVELKHGSRAIGIVRKGEKLTVSQINGEYLYVTGANNRAGWLMLKNVQLTN
jgi:hypothetical protein